jgi:hypothetical protein
VPPTTQQLNPPITGCHPPSAGIGSFAVAASANRVVFRANEGVAGGGAIELYVTTNLGGTVTTAGVNGATVPGVQGVSDFAADPTGTHILFTADGAGGARDLYVTTMTGGAPTTKRVVQVAAPTTGGVSLFGARTFVTATRAIFALDDQVGGQARLFTVDVAAATFAPVLVPGAGAFPASGTGLATVGTRALAAPTPNGSAIVFATDQGTGAAGHLALYSSPLAAPAPTLLGTAGLDLGAVPPPAGATVMFAQAAAGSAKPVTVWRNTIGHAGETAVSGAELAGTTSAAKLEVYSPTRALYFAQDSTGVATLYVANVGGGAPVALSQASASGVPSLSFKTDADP